MDFKTFFEPEIDIRLTDDLDGFVCTVRRRLFPKDSTAFSIHSELSLSPEPVAHSARRNPPYSVVLLRLRQKDPRS